MVKHTDGSAAWGHPLWRAPKGNPRDPAIPSTPYQEGCRVEGLQRQPAALSVEAQLQALGRRMLLADAQTPIPARDTLPRSPTSTFRAQCSFL